MTALLLIERLFWMVRMVVDAIRKPAVPELQRRKLHRAGVVFFPHPAGCYSLRWETAGMEML